MQDRSCWCGQVVARYFLLAGLLADANAGQYPSVGTSAQRNLGIRWGVDLHVTFAMRTPGGEGGSSRAADSDGGSGPVGILLGCQGCRTSLLWSSIPSRSSRRGTVCQSVRPAVDLHGRPRCVRELRGGRLLHRHPSGATSWV